MKFLVDAQLPRRLATLLQQAGYDVLHTLDLPLGNHTPDKIINELSVKEQCVVMTKDADFVDSYLVSQKPWKLLLVSTGNIRNDELMVLFELNLAQLSDLKKNSINLGRRISHSTREYCEIFSPKT